MEEIEIVNVWSPVTPIQSLSEGTKFPDDGKD